MKRVRERTGKMQYVRIIYMYERLGFFFFYFEPPQNLSGFYLNIYSFLHVLWVLKCNLLNLFFFFNMKTSR